MVIAKATLEDVLFTRYIISAQGICKNVYFFLL
jgi:hypothetical protein